MAIGPPLLPLRRPAAIATMATRPSTARAAVAQLVDPGGSDDGIVDLVARQHDRGAADQRRQVHAVDDLEPFLVLESP